jgi:hypothetical protein
LVPNARPQSSSQPEARAPLEAGVRGPVPAQRRHTRSAFLFFGMATPVLSVEEGAAALLASLKSFQQPRQGGSGEKGDPFCGPYLTHGTLAAPDLPRHPCRPKGANRPESDGQPRVRHQPFPNLIRVLPRFSADLLRCDSEERYWRYRTALDQQGCRRHRAGDGLASRMARGRPVASAPPRSRRDQ